VAAARCANSRPARKSPPIFYVTSTDSLGSNADPTDRGQAVERRSRLHKILALQRSAVRPNPNPRDGAIPNQALASPGPTQLSSRAPILLSNPILDPNRAPIHRSNPSRRANLRTTQMRALKPMWPR
jgi:hypothetical protein